MGHYLSSAAALADTPTFVPPPQTVLLADMLPYLARMAWSFAHMRWRLVGAFVALVVTKGFGMIVPLYFKQAIDALSLGTSGAALGFTPAAVRTAVVALVLSGVAKIVSGLAKEYQMVVFTPVAQGVGRQVSFHTFK